jgi:hypothetical protein
MLVVMQNIGGLRSQSKGFGHLISVQLSSRNHQILFTNFTYTHEAPACIGEKYGMENGMHTTSFAKYAIFHSNLVDEIQPSGIFQWFLML